jgi:hypothetical protein
MIESAGILPLRRPEDEWAELFRMEGGASWLRVCSPVVWAGAGEVIQVEQEGQGPLVPAISGRMDNFNPHAWQ